MRLQTLTEILWLSCLVLTSEGQRGRSKVPSKYFDQYHRNQISHKDEVNDLDEERDEKLLSLFSIVQFKNEPCRSTSTLTGGTASSGYRNGTCYTREECSDKGGSASGGCAAGFGVCCVFILSSEGTVSQNCTYIRNPDYPSPYGQTSTIRYTITKCSPEVCDIRLDFESFTLVGTTDTTETSGGTCTDMFTISTSASSTIPTICGLNTGQHMYVDMGALSSDTATLNFDFSGDSNIRQWDIKVTQVPCNGRGRAPDGCLQYHTGVSGRITSFNFLDSGGTHLASQQYSACVRQEEGYCCVQWSVCGDQDSSFSIDGGDAPTISGVDTACTQDYLGIDTSGNLCGTTGTTLSSKYCGNCLNPDITLDPCVNVPICDCTAPFALEFYTDATQDTAGTANTAVSRGFCLDYQQIAC